MIRKAQILVSLLLCASLSGCATLQPAPAAYGVTGKSRIFEDMGSHARTITTESPEAQKYFNQGVNWLYSFNHDEAVRAFTKATELDTGCAMAWWGVSYARGRTITTRS